MESETITTNNNSSNNIKQQIATQNENLNELGNKNKVKNKMIENELEYDNRDGEIQVNLKSKLLKRQENN